MHLLQGYRQGKDSPIHWKNRVFSVFQ